MKPMIMTKLYLVYEDGIKAKSVYYNVTNNSLINTGKYANNEGAKYFFCPFSYGYHLAIYSTNDLSCVAILNPFDFDKNDNLTGDKTFNLIMDAIKKETREFTCLYFSLTKDGAKMRSLLKPPVEAKV